MNNRVIPEVGPEHLPGLIVAQQLARKYEDRQLLGFLIHVATRKAEGNHEEGTGASLRPPSR